MPLLEMVLVDDAAALEGALAALPPMDAVGVDVERADWQRYWRSAALIQVGGEGHVVVVDPLAVADLAPLDRFLSGRTVVLHALENDLGPLETAGIRPACIEDTAIAAAICGLPTGLEVLLSELLALEPSNDKAAMQRADWERRPLTPAMLSYAAGDVADLPALWAALASRLDDLGRRGWYDEELAATLAQPPVEVRRDWARTKGIGRLDAQARGRVRALWTAREALAKDTDTAPGRILKDEVLVDLATTPPAHARELGRRGMRRRAIREFGDAVLEALRASEGAEPPPRSGRRTTEDDRALADRLRVIRAQIAEEIGIDAGVLCPSKVLIGGVIAAASTPDELKVGLELRDWQWALLSERFCEAAGIPPA